MVAVMLHDVVNQSLSRGAYLFEVLNTPLTWCANKQSGVTQFAASEEIAPRAL